MHDCCDKKQAQPGTAVIDVPDRRYYPIESYLPYIPRGIDPRVVNPGSPDYAVDPLGPRVWRDAANPNKGLI